MAKYKTEQRNQKPILFAKHPHGMFLAVTKRIRLIACVLAMAVMLVLLFSVCFMAVEADHDCMGEDCPICYQINVCEKSLKSLGLAVIAVIHTAFWGALAVFLLSFTKEPPQNTSLISLKVKLSI